MTTAIATTYRALYDDPPTPESPQFTGGSSSTSAFSPVAIPLERGLPRLLTQDTHLCDGLRQFAQQYLGHISRQPPESLIHRRRLVSDDMEENGIGDEERVDNLLTMAATYSRRFIAQAENIDISCLWMGSCEEIGGVRPDLISKRYQISRLVIENKGIAAFGAHRSGIEQLARANNGRGTELICSLPERDSRSIIFKIGKHMIDMTCPWGLIFGGEWFFLLFLNPFKQDGETYYQLCISPCQQTFGAAPHHNLVQLYIAIHLGAHQESFGQIYKPRKPTIPTPYKPQKQDPRQKHFSQKQKRSLSDTQQMPPRRSPRFQYQVLRQKNFTISWPLSILPDRTIHVENLDTLIKGFEMPEQPFELSLFEELGSGRDGVVCEGALCRENECFPCAVKIVQNDITAFQTEAEVYGTLGDTAYTPSFYGAFQGVYQDRPVGIIVMDLLDSTFKSAADMTTDQRQDALECLREIHRNGFCRVDPGPRNFGVKDGKVVIFDFAHARPCSPDHGDERREIESLKCLLFDIGR